jgi:hypothetical protein
VSDDFNQNAYSPPPSNGLAIASLVVGIIALLMAFIPVIGMISWILAPAGLIMGLMSMNRPTGRGLAIGGAVTSGIALLLCILWVVGLAGIMAAGSASGY